MSDHEFDTYLSLLTSLLRLDGKQRGRIADELRSHLEDRLEELTERGLPREEAIRQALVEFGDAAGLAAEFRSLSWNRKRRWIMRVTTFSAAATLLIAAGIITFWPGTNAGPGIAQVAAQNEEQPKENQPEKRPAEVEDVTERMRLEAKLNERIELEFIETPLKDAVLHIQEQTGIPLILSAKHLEEAGVSVDHPVTSSLNLRLSTALDLILRELELAYVVQDEYVLITTPEVAETMLIIRVYDCRDLISMPWPDAEKKPAAKAAARAGGNGSGYPGALGSGYEGSGYGGGYGGEAFGTPGSRRAGTIVTPLPDSGVRSGTTTPPPSTLVPREIMPQFEAGGDEEKSPAPPLTEHEKRVERLIDLITTNVYPNSWSDQGGPGSISEYGGLIVITQTAETHKTVERVLEMLREAAGLPQPGGGGFF